MIFTEPRVGDGLRGVDVFFMQTPAPNLHARGPCEWAVGRRLMQGSAGDRISRFAKFSLALALTVVAWACSSKPGSEGVAFVPITGVIMGSRVSAAPTATPTPSSPQ